MAAITVVGSINADMTLRLDRLPRPGETVLGHHFSMGGGGKGANQAIAARRAGVPVSLIGAVGDDLFGTQALDRLAADKLDTRWIARASESPTGVAFIFVDDRGENSIGVGPGANAALRVADVEAARSAIATADALLIQLETALAPVEAAIAIAVSNRVPVILNPAPACTLSPALLRQISIITPNRVEAETLTGIPVPDAAGARAAAASLHNMGIETVIVTMGGDGLLVSQGGEMIHLAAHPVTAVDSTAAGDAFNGAFAAGLAEKLSLLDAARFANAAAAVSVTRAGTQISMPYRAEIDAFIEQESVTGRYRS